MGGVYSISPQMKSRDSREQTGLKGRSKSQVNVIRSDCFNETSETAARIDTQLRIQIHVTESNSVSLNLPKQPHTHTHTRPKKQEDPGRDKNTNTDKESRIKSVKR